jgi:hypothetical protein
VTAALPRRWSSSTRVDGGHLLASGGNYSGVPSTHLVIGATAVRRVLVRMAA